MPVSGPHWKKVAATPPVFTPTSPKAPDAERMIQALEFIAQRMANIEFSLAQLNEQLSQPR